MAVKYDSECAAVGRCLIFAEKEALVLSSSLSAGLQNLELLRKYYTEIILLKPTTDMRKQNKSKDFQMINICMIQKADRNLGNVDNWRNSCDTSWWQCVFEIFKLYKYNIHLLNQSDQQHTEVVLTMISCITSLRPARYIWCNNISILTYQKHYHRHSLSFNFCIKHN